MLVVVGLNQRTATIAERERLAPRAGELEADLAALVSLGELDEVAALANCWRVEIYAATRCPAAALLALREALTRRAGRRVPLFAFQGERAFSHLVRVASGLESPILGEAQVLAGVKDAFERAMLSGAAGIELTSTAACAFEIARRARAELPALGVDVSWGHAVAALAEKVVGPVEGRRVAVVGAGEVARISGGHLGARGGDVVVLDGNLALAEELARQLGAEARRLEALDEEMLRADVVVAASPVALDAFRPERLARASRARERRMVLVDLSVPRAIAPEVSALPDVYLCDVDDLDRVMRAMAVPRRTGAIARAERLIEQEVGRWARGDDALHARAAEISP